MRSIWLIHNWTLFRLLCIASRLKEKLTWGLKWLDHFTPQVLPLTTRSFSSSPPHGWGQPSPVDYQESGNFFCKGQNSKYFRICGLYSLCCNYSTLIVVQKQPQTMHKKMSLAVFQWHSIYKQAVGQVCPAGPCPGPGLGQRLAKEEWWP